MVIKDKVTSKKAILLNGDIEILGLIHESSNGALKAKISLNDTSIHAIIKPNALIRPLWDFPEMDLNYRELATFNLSERLDLNFVPYSVLREIKDIGICLVQEWIDEVSSDLVIIKNDLEIPKDYKKVLNGYDDLNKLVSLAHKDDHVLRSIAIFDLIINNADRKGGHILKDANQKIWVIDHGVSWHTENKLRTILWGWIGDELSSSDVQLMNRAKQILNVWRDEETEYLKPDEINAAISRVDVVLQEGKFPEPSKEWPAIPWPIF